MKIAFDAQLLMKGEKTGIAWCAENILHKFADYQYDIQLNCFTLGYSKEKFHNVSKYSKFGYNIKKCIWFHDVIYRMLCSIIPIPYSLFFRKKADVTVFFNYVIPPGVKGKKITFVHDMAYKSCPDTVRRRTKDMLNFALKKSCSRADKIITVSEFSKREIIHYLGISEDKISVMPNGVDFSLYHNRYTTEEVEHAVQKYGIYYTYFLYLGTLEPRKNIVRLIQAYAMLKKDIHTLPKLVIAGRKGWMYDEIFCVVKELDLDADVIFTGYVDAEDAPLLVKGAELFLFPSLYEGFGMPPLEAMACGTPVLVSNIPPLIEIVSDAGIYVDPLSVDSIYEGMKYFVINENERYGLSQKGIERAANFSWEKSAEIINTTIRDLLMTSEGGK